MSRLRGRAPCGDRCRSPVPHGHWKTTTFTGALRLSGMTAPMVLDGARTGWRSKLMSSRFSCQPWHRATSSSWTICQRTRQKAYGIQSKVLDAACFISRPTVPTSTPSRRPLPSSRLSCAPKVSERSRAYGMRSARSSHCSNRRNAQTTSNHADMIPSKVDAL